MPTAKIWTGSEWVTFGTVGPPGPVWGRRVLTLSSNSATPAINTDDYDAVHIIGQSTPITSFTTNLSGTPVDGQLLRISITNSTASNLAVTWGSSFEASNNIGLPTVVQKSSVANGRLDTGLLWNTETSKWRCVSVA